MEQVKQSGLPGLVAIALVTPSPANFAAESDRWKKAGEAASDSRVDTMSSTCPGASVRSILR